MNNLEIIFACSDAGIHVDGAKDGAYKLYNKIEFKNKILLYQEKFTKEKNLNNKQKNLKQVNNFNTNLYNKVNEVLEKNNKILTIGGDHSIAIGSILGSVNHFENVGVIWIDAHGDFNTFETTITGNLHGLPLAVVDGYEKKKLCPFHNGMKVNPHNTVIIGGRDFDAGEIINLKDAGVTIFNVKDIRNMGISCVVKKAIEIAGNKTNNIHISYDVDVIDPIIAPGVSIPAVEGISKDEAYILMDEILKYKDNINSFDIVEFNCLRDKNDITYKITMDLINKVIAKL